VPNDNKNSGQSLAQIVAEKGSPVADIVYLGVTFGIEAKEARCHAALQAQALG
jgi:putative spermidine/putrescine transport system substrate-binding protein